MKNLRLYRFLLLVSVLTIFIGNTQAQPLDRIVAIIGEEIILESDIDNQYNYMVINGQKDDGTLRCQVMDNLIVSKLLLNKAIQDSIEISEAEVEVEIDRRVTYTLEQMGGEKKFMEVYGKTVDKFKLDIRDDIRGELLINKQRSVMMEGATITPKEVKQFFKIIPIDSLGLLPAEVQINHIVINPPFSDESEQRAKGTLAELRRKILDESADFGELAAKNTDEPGGKERRGDLGWFGRGQMVPEFEEVAYQMRVGEVSEPFKTEFGYHIVKLYEKRGEMVHAAHILKRLSYSTNGDSIAIDSLNKIMELVNSDSLTFEQAAILYSSDRNSKHCGGCISNPQTNELRIPMDALDADMYFKIDEMNPGEISKPMELLQPDGSRAFHVVYLKTKIPPHTPNLQDDYQKIQNAALQNKQAEIFDKWLQSAKKNIYIDIKPTECSNALKNWVE
ncbi:MAG: peptidylprolyl isomerase [Bacteroidia bacterium]|nr:peptidylprolyl isomerase [Bacteroidia bacterium]